MTANNTNVDRSLIFTTLSKNSATLYTYENKHASSKYPKLNFQEIIDENLAFINGSVDSGNMFGSTISFQGGSPNNLVMYYAKDITDENDLITVVTVVGQTASATFVYMVLNDILTAFKEDYLLARDSGTRSSIERLQSYDSAAQATSQQSSTSNVAGRKTSEPVSFKLKMTAIIEESANLGSTQYGSAELANAEIDQVRTLMSDNIERVLQRGERINLLVDKTDKLNNASNSFRRRTVAIRRRLWWNNVKFIVIAIICALIVLYLIGGEFCGLPAYGECFNRGPGSN